MKKRLLIIGVICIVLSAAALIHQGITYITREKVFSFERIEAAREARKTTHLPPFLGGVAVAAGILLVFGASKKIS